jgi:dihydropyrimidinase
LQRKGQSLREAVAAYHVKADGNSLLDYGFHLIISDPTPAVFGQELPALIADSYTSVTIFMTYDDLVLKDREILDVLSIARQYGARVMIHAEGYDQIKFITDKLERPRPTIMPNPGRSLWSGRRRIGPSPMPSWSMSP